MPKVGVKAQTLSEFLVDYTLIGVEEEEIMKDDVLWSLFVDWASKEERIGIKIILWSPTGKLLYHAVRIFFPISFIW